MTREIPSRRQTGTRYEEKAADFLKQQGYEILEKNYRDRYGEVDPDLVTMDIIMPGIDGLETAEAILKDYPFARIVMVSSLAYDDTINEADNIGVKAFVYKPLEREMLLEAFEKAMAQS